MPRFDNVVVYLHRCVTKCRK